MPSDVLLQGGNTCNPAGQVAEAGATAFLHFGVDDYLDDVQKYVQVYCLQSG
jgi:hypothetical protein